MTPRLASLARGRPPRLASLARGKGAGVLVSLFLACWSYPAFAQTDLMGSWRPLPRNQDGSGRW
ncbi:MAG TPA: hypothetical protein VEP46_17240 [Vicinamibacterales bacterium]|nr:hypothetical protein [Vicinamibacterales bacterium]